jgi:hypothetical protein
MTRITISPLLSYLLCASFLLVGCGKKAEQELPTDEGTEANREGDPRPTEAPPKKMGGREFRVVSKYDLSKAFADNPQRAKRDYGKLRWRLHVRVDQINQSRIIAGSILSGDAGYATITMRSTREVEQLSRSKPAIIEACVSEFKPHEWQGVHFEDGVFVEQAKSPEPPAAGEPIRDLTPNTLKEMVDVFGRGSAWGRSKYPGRWAFTGTVEKRTERTGSTYIINCPDIGKVEIAFPGGSQPKIGSVVSVDAIPQTLVVSDGENLRLQFSAPNRK